MTCEPSSLKPKPSTISCPMVEVVSPCWMIARSCPLCSPLRFRVAFVFEAGATLLLLSIEASFCRFSFFAFVSLVNTFFTFCSVQVKRASQFAITSGRVLNAAAAVAAVCFVPPGFSPSQYCWHLVSINDMVCSCN
jgi:hypothetical protein